MGSHVRQAQRRDRVLVLAVDVQDGPAGDHDLGFARGVQQFRDSCPGGYELLEVVQDQQDLAVLQGGGELIYR